MYEIWGFYTGVLGIPVFWDTKLCRWVSGSDFSKGRREPLNQQHSVTSQNTWRDV
jgi:hypothetical protein